MVKDNTSVLFNSGKQIVEKMKNLENVTREITDSMNKITSDSSEINQSVELCQKLSKENRSNLEKLNNNVSMFKIYAFRLFFKFA